MRYKLLGKTGLRVSELALGTMTFGEDWGWGASQEESKKIFDAFSRAGGNFIDTACNYTNGTSEKYVGEFVKSDRDHFVVATKFTLSERKGDLNFGGNHRKNLLRTLKNSLDRLQTDYLDLLWLHMWDSTTPVEEVMHTLNDLVREGQVLHIAVSDTPAWVVARANTLAEMRGWARFEALQVPYSLVNRDVERDLLPMAKAFDMSVTPWAIIAGGVLSGKYNREGDEPTRQNRDSVPPERLKIAEAVSALAQELGQTPSQVAINWVRGQGSNVIPLLGARTETQIRDNLGCLDFSLSIEQIQRLNEAAPINLGFPHTMLTSENVRNLVFGDSFNLLDMR